ncbi:lysosome membrane protein 2 isoform X1 [Gadus morhua]|uniref:Nucleoporin 54 n=1 Tax=Gadus morhua TaxID=8049 RepID=A0A8C5CA59_GADMO|nr:lysosome membrane protein 2-like isoform X1 [Gadus morhua]XP_030211226.1 lysosome membrane protein 2-like isoform X1 [Gadus morhua]
MTRRSCALCLVGIACANMLVIGIGLTLSHVFRNIIHNRLKGEITLTEGSRVFESWKSPPPPVYMQYFFFNITNLAEVEGGAMAVLSQVGPYTYREYRPKANVTVAEDGMKVSAYCPKTFVFLREKSVGDPADDVVNTINIPAWAVMNKAKGFFKASAASIWLRGMGVGLYTTRTVAELLWGYEDPMLVSLATTNPEVEGVFGLMYKKNGSLGGEFVYHTGKQNFMDYGRVHTWSGQSQLTFWNSNQSNSINGTDGSAFHPLLSRDERLYVFTSDLCRSIFMEFEKDVTVKGIPAYRFTPPRAVLASKEENPANEGFCVTPKECLGSGVLNVSPCRKGAPVVASFPHFYLGDPKYANGVTGLNPVKELHQTFLDLNPTTGIPVRASKKAQVNIHIGRVQYFPATKNLNDTIFPVMFINETVEIDDASAERLKRLLLIETVVSNFPLLIVGLGAILLVVFIILLFRSRRQQKEVKKIAFTKPLYAASFSPQSTAKDDSPYTAVGQKEKEDPQNGTDMNLSPLTSEQ